VDPAAFHQELVVVTRPAPTTRFLATDGRFAGLEEDLVDLFRRELDVPVRTIEADDYSDVLARLGRGEAHLGAAALTASPGSTDGIRFGPGYMTVRQVLVWRRTDPVAGRWKLTDGASVALVPDASALDRMDRSLSGGLPRGLRLLPASSPEDAGKLLSAGAAEYAVTGSHVSGLLRAADPAIRVARSLGEPEQLAWAFPADADPGLLRAASRFFRRIRADGTLARLIDRYYGHVDRLTDTDRGRFLARCDEALAEYREAFHAAQHHTGIDWRLIAALGYQESRWDPRAVSPTGVRGFMMLTEDTASRLGLRDKLDARSSILAGARYLRTLRDALPARIPEPDRTWMALAAYNQGLGHLEDARVLAQRQGGNPDAWMDVRRALPLLADEAYRQDLRYGPARGGEALALTENVRAYHQILLRLEPALDQTPVREASIPPPSDSTPLATDGFLL
jgi:membrane-bound lytic murein transglycosylase F